MFRQLLLLALVGFIMPFSWAWPICTGSRTPSASKTMPTATTVPTLDPAPTPGAGTTDRMVFAHFMMGITSNRLNASDYDGDMQQAKAAGIDAFALNIGTDPFTDTQLDLAYESAANNDMKVFISFDFNWWKTSDAGAVGAKTKQYADHPAQLKVDGKVFVSSFAGDGLDVGALRAAVGQEIFFAPNFQPAQSNFDDLDAALNWMAWPSNGENKAPTVNRHVSVVQGDQAYIDALKGKPYIAPISPWFSTHFGSEVSYSKNWVFPSDLLWYNRWRDILAKGPRFVEIITWNDYGESHYVGPLSSPHTDDGASKWVMDMPHTGWLDMAKPFIAAYKAGATDAQPYVQEEKLVYWYRPTKEGVNCDATDNTMEGTPNNSTGNFFAGRPNGYHTMADEVFVVAMLQSPAQVVVNSGGQTTTFDAPAGITAYKAPMGTGPQQFAVARNGQNVLSGTSARDIGDTCNCGIYNFNAYVGTLPAPAVMDQLQPTGHAMLTKGLKMVCPTTLQTHIVSREADAA
ncbi:putative alpha-1,3-glucanase [Penicillium oxalicum 114-2]|uniref:Putative alpha-1,3-glucanase n=1 Tax=Penicillium oxalicum (strain 114-2 / CGMCC 5302) TaxID=933388 RepID=S8B6I8_PENO1|nr:putative alpha-1,3-glucanase [Penicillium oxalicum 114-2]